MSGCLLNTHQGLKCRKITAIRGSRFSLFSSSCRHGFLRGGRISPADDSGAATATATATTAAAATSDVVSFGAALEHPGRGNEGSGHLVRNTPLSQSIAFRIHNCFTDPCSSPHALAPADKENIEPPSPHPMSPVDFFPSPGQQQQHQHNSAAYLSDGSHSSEEELEEINKTPPPTT